MVAETLGINLLKCWPLIFVCKCDVERATVSTVVLFIILVCGLI